MCGATRQDRKSFTPKFAPSCFVSSRGCTDTQLHRDVFGDPGQIAGIVEDVRARSGHTADFRQKLLPESFFQG